ncbi:hypothetical protein Dda_3465 [Drechslerella dactyloides]|uniref:Uncharacterized protein n=1 Tax=Drechslerella dactyloides TaxID=74499 RepID=A0AAD6J1E7_DREDA|nr:hypothetical protein Dda_3465 [Drechslerella dactyloides]
MSDHSSRVSSLISEAETESIPDDDGTPDPEIMAHKQEAVEKLLDRGKLWEAIALHEDVGEEIFEYRQLVIAEKVRRLKIAIPIQKRATELFNNGPPIHDTLPEYDELYERAIDHEMVAEEIDHDLLLPESQFGRLTRTMRAVAKLLETAFIDSLDEVEETLAKDCVRYYAAFSFPACLKHRVFSNPEIYSFNLRVLEGIESEDDTMENRSGEEQEGQVGEWEEEHEDEEDDEGEKQMCVEAEQDGEDG